MRQVESRERGYAPPVLISLVVATLIIPLVGIAVGSLDMFFCNKAKQGQGVWLLALGLVMLFLFAAVKFSL